MIECYYSSCPSHDCNFDAESGPFCSNLDCTATPDQLEEYRKIRLDYLRKNCNLPDEDS